MAPSNRTKIPGSKLAREITETVRDTEPALLFNQSSRVYLFAALTGSPAGMSPDADRELPALAYVCVARLLVHPRPSWSALDKTLPK